MLFLEQSPGDEWQQPWRRPKWEKRLTRGLIYARLMDAGIDDAVCRFYDLLRIMVHSDWWAELPNLRSALAIDPKKHGSCHTWLGHFLGLLVRPFTAAQDLPEGDAREAYLDFLHYVVRALQLLLRHAMTDEADH